MEMELLLDDVTKPGAAGVDWGKVGRFAALVKRERHIHKEAYRESRQSYREAARERERHTHSVRAFVRVCVCACVCVCV